MMFTYQDLLFSVALAVYVAASVMVAAVRWGHKCEPYARRADYYYPAWKVIVLSFLSNVLMAPAIFLPTEADAVLQLRLLLMMASPFFCAVLLFSYFGRVLKIFSWQKPVYALAFPFGVMAATATVFAFVPGTQLEGVFCQWFFAVGGVLSLAFLACFVVAFRMVVRTLSRFSEENWSNPEDFPKQYASRIIWIPALHLVVSWVMAFIGTKAVLSAGLLVLSVLNVVLLIGILSPHRAQEVQLLETEAAAEKEESGEPALSQERQEEILRAVRHCVEDEEAYLDPHFTLNDLAQRAGFNRGYVSYVMNTCFGGFFNYVNCCRYYHVSKLQLERPEAPVGELIDMAGFGARSTYYSIRRKLGE